MRTERSELARTLSLVLGALAVAGTTACAEVPEAEPTLSDVQEVTVQDPNGVYFATITANGTGCPRGTWEVDIAPDGQTFTLTFSEYEVILNPGQVIKVKDCQIGVKLHSPQGLSYSISDFFYSGFAFLDKPGMTATQTAGYYFQGNPIDSTSARTDLPGPFDADYVFTDQIGLPDLVWSPCGTDRMLNIPTRLIAKNNPAKTGTGYINTLAVDGSVQLTFTLQWKSCP
jgi:hypothetical protein